VREIDSIDEKNFKTCWDYYNCSEESKKICPAYKIGNENSNFNDCPLWIPNIELGGPEKHGPCYQCEWYKKFHNFHLKL